MSSALVHRILPAEPYATLDDYLAAGGGRALDAARQVEPEALIAEIEAAGLRGRGGAGFPTAHQVAHDRGQRLARAGRTRSS